MTTAATAQDQDQQCCPGPVYIEVKFFTPGKWLSVTTGQCTYKLKLLDLGRNKRCSNHLPCCFSPSIYPHNAHVGLSVCLCVGGGVSADCPPEEAVAVPLSALT